MSIRIMSEVWELDLTPVEKLVLLAIADCANDEGLAWPSIATIRRKAGVGERTVQRSIRTLEEMGLLDRQEVIGKGCKYIVHPRHAGTPATKSPPPHRRETPATVAPKPLRTTIDKKARAQSLSSGWQPQPFTDGQCKQVVAGWSASDLAAQVEHFTSHHQAKGSTFVDWQAAWRTWVLNSRKWGNNRTPTPSNDAGSLVKQILARQAASP